MGRRSEETFLQRRYINYQVHKKMLNINITYTLEYYSDIKKNEITIWDNMDRF